jgi:hypothetical protein
MLAPPTSALRDYGLASQARETDGDGAPIFTPEFPKADPYLIWKGARCVELSKRCTKHPIFFKGMV